MLESPTQSTTAYGVYRMSWTAYIRPAVVLFFMSSIGLVLANFNGWLAFAVVAAAAGWFTFNALTIHSLLLYTDDHGVWVYSGILPWSRGTFGVKWRDLEDAVYYPNFLSWLFQSYTVRVGHRFTKSSEIVLPQIACGDEAVIHINALHRQMLTNGVLGNIS